MLVRSVWQLAVIFTWENNSSMLLATIIKGVAAEQSFLELFCNNEREWFQQFLWLASQRYHRHCSCLKSEFSSRIHWCIQIICNCQQHWAMNEKLKSKNGTKANLTNKNEENGRNKDHFMYLVIYPQSTK